MKRVLGALLVLVILGLGSVTAYLSINQADIIFDRSDVAPDHDWGFAENVELFDLKRPDGAHIHAAYFPQAEARGTILFFHGNGQNLSAGPRMAAYFKDLGFSLVAVQRRESGNSTGKLTQQGLYDDAAAWWDWARARFGDDHDLRVVGYSMGTAWASYLAQARPVKDMILFAPFESMLDMSTRRSKPLPRAYFDLLLDFPLPSHELLLRARDTKIRIYHGKADKIVPIDSSYKLKASLNADDAFVEFDGLNHWTIIWDDRTRADVRAAWGS